MGEKMPMEGECIVAVGRTGELVYDERQQQEKE